MQRVCAVLVVLSALSPLAAAQQTWWVDDNAAPGGNGSYYAPLRSIQSAVDRSHDGDTIRVRPGLYNERVDYVLRSIRVVSTEGPAFTTLRGNQDGSVVRLKGGTPVLEGFTVENGSGNYVPSLGATVGGGVLFDDTVDGRVLGCVIRNNYADRGDGIGAVLAQGVVWDTRIENNGGPSYPGYCQTSDMGGGVFGAGTLWLSHCTLRSNNASIYGGGALAANLDHCVIEGNRAAEGAGIAGCYAVDCIVRNNAAYSCDGSLTWGGGALHSTLERCELTGNSSGDAGGGAAFCTLLGCQIVQNGLYYPDPWVGLGRGGGAFECELEDCRVERNFILHDPHAYYPLPGEGGGVAGGTARRCVFTRNTAGDTAGVFQTRLDRCVVYGNLGIGVHIGDPLTNTIVWGNSGPQWVAGGDVRWCDIEGGYPGLGNIDADPLFVDAPNGDFHLSAGSPCIDAGDPSQSDLNGTRLDIGAFPYVSPLAPPRGRRQR